MQAAVRRLLSGEQEKKEKNMSWIHEHELIQEQSPIAKFRV